MKRDGYRIKRKELNETNQTRPNLPGRRSNEDQRSGVIVNYSAKSARKSVVWSSMKKLAALGYLWQVLIYKYYKVE